MTAQATTVQPHAVRDSSRTQWTTPAMHVPMTATLAMGQETVSVVCPLMEEI